MQLCAKLKTVAYNYAMKYQILDAIASVSYLPGLLAKSVTIFSSPEPKTQKSYSDQNLSIIDLVVNIFFSWTTGPISAYIHSILFIDLNWFLRWAMWPMGLLFKILHFCGLQFDLDSQVVTFLISIDRIFSRQSNSLTLTFDINRDKRYWANDICTKTRRFTLTLNHVTW